MQGKIIEKDHPFYPFQKLHWGLRSIVRDNPYYEFLQPPTLVSNSNFIICHDAPLNWFQQIDNYFITIQR